MWVRSREGAESEGRETPRGGRAPAPDKTPDEGAEDAGKTEAAGATVTVRADLGIFQKERKKRKRTPEREGKREKEEEADRTNSKPNERLG